LLGSIPKKRALFAEQVTAAEKVGERVDDSARLRRVDLDRLDCVVQEAHRFLLGRD